VARIVPTLDELKDRHARFDLTFEAAAVEQFAYERGEETFAHGAVEAIADRAHRGPHAGLGATSGQKRAKCTGCPRRNDA
jgi:hypothetical protein